ncbi:MAG: hypothetical protein E7620_08870 [Ruminococcaceae bacterium]|nr:hypothetical protein [Oscillospiraceae bacterium]
MIIFTNPLLLAAIIVACVLHGLAIFLPGILSKVINYVNIGLHIASLALLMWQRAEVDEALLFYVVSIFVYTALAFAQQELCRAKASDKEDEV